MVGIEVTEENTDFMETIYNKSNVRVLKIELVDI